MSDEQVYSVPVENIRTAAFNPPNRTDKRSIHELMESIKQFGILMPLMITHDCKLIDGHRRLACAKELGMTDVPCIIRTGDQVELFSAVNTTSRKLNRADDLTVYLAGGKLAARSKATVSALEKLIGKDGLEVVAERQMSPATILTAARMLLNYIGIIPENAGPYSKAAIMWVIRQKQTFAVRLAITMGIPVETIIDCINNDKPLPVYQGA